MFTSSDDLGAEGRRADHAADSGRRGAVDGLAEHRRRAGRLEAEVGAAAGDPATASTASSSRASTAWVAPSSRASSSRARSRSTPMIVVQPAMHRGHARRRARRRPCRRRRCVLPAGAPQRVQHRAGAGLDAAAERRGDSRAMLVRQPDDVALARDGVRREARLPEEVGVDQLAVARERARAVAAGPPRSCARRTRGSTPAGRSGRSGSGRRSRRSCRRGRPARPRHSRADRLDDARRPRGRAPPAAAPGTTGRADQVGVADPGGGDATSTSSRRELAELELLERERRALRSVTAAVILTPLPLPRARPSCGRPPSSPLARRDRRSR